MSSVPNLTVLTVLSVFALGAPLLAQGDSKPIVDVRFDGPYLQLEYSSGDEWAPTWGADDVLYTGNDDGASFGGIPGNAIAFGKVEGDSPKNFKGTTLNGMADYMEIPPPGPEGALWKTVNSYKMGNKLYRLTPCQQATCLAASADSGKTWSMEKKVFELNSELRFIVFSAGYQRELQLFGKNKNTVSL